jgi:hypothetical protein
LIDTAETIATDRALPTTTYPPNDDECSKLITSLALKAASAVHLDNLDEDRSYGGGVLDSAIKSMFINNRILGKSKTTGEIPMRTILFVTGNNISPRRDAARRW